MLADLLIHTVQQAAAAAAAAGTGYGSNGSAGASSDSGGRPARAYQERCLLARDFEKAVATEGFRWSPERPDATTWAAQKWRWRGKAPGQWAELEFDSRQAAAEPGAVDVSAGSSSSRNATAEGMAAAPVHVALGYLLSYQGMGNASVECVSGTSCEVRVQSVCWRSHRMCSPPPPPTQLPPPPPTQTSLLIGTWQRHASLTASLTFPTSQAPACPLRVEVLPPSGDAACAAVGGCKVALTSLAVSSSPLEIGETDFQRENPW